MLKLAPVVLLVFYSLCGLSQINMVVKPGGFLFMEGKDSIFFYQKSQKDKNGQFSRCNYLHPFYGVDGRVLTEDFPDDHLHQRGIFWAWHQVLIDGKQIADGWELKNFEQKVTSFEYRLQKGAGVVDAIVEWKSPEWKNGKEAYIKENTKITIFPKSGNYRRIDFEIQLKSLTDRLSIGGSNDEKGYGGFSARLKLPDNVNFSSENGAVEPQNLPIESGNFMNISGSFLNGNKQGGVIMFANESNPTPNKNWILRKSASMQNAAFPGKVPVGIPFDKPLVLKYSLIVYQGEMTTRQIKKALK